MKTKGIWLYPSVYLGRTKEYPLVYGWIPECSRQQYLQRNTVAWWSCLLMFTRTVIPYFFLFFPFPWHLFSYKHNIFSPPNHVTLFTGKNYYFLKYFHINLQKKQNHIKARKWVTKTTEQNWKGKTVLFLF